MTAALKLQTRPNGLAISPEGNTLYVTNSDERNVRAYDIAKDGSLQNERMFVAATEGVPDGIEVDEKGNVYVAAAGVSIYSPKGERLVMIDLAEKPSNLGVRRRRLEVAVRNGAIYAVPGANGSEGSVALLAADIQNGRFWAWAH